MMSVDRIRGYIDEPQSVRSQQQPIAEDQPAIDIASQFLKTTIQRQPVACLIGGLIVGVFLGCIVKRQ